MERERKSKLCPEVIAQANEDGSEHGQFVARDGHSLKTSLQQLYDVVDLQCGRERMAHINRPFPYGASTPVYRPALHLPPLPNPLIGFHETKKDYRVSTPYKKFTLGFLPLVKVR